MIAKAAIVLAFAMSLALLASSPEFDAGMLSISLLLGVALLSDLEDEEDRDD